MAANATRSTRNGRHPMGWQATIGGMIDAEATARVVCSTCGLSKDIDLKAIEEKMGREFSLWDRRPKCREPGCDGRAFFHSNLRNSPSRAMKSF